MSQTFYIFHKIIFGIKRICLIHYKCMNSNFQPKMANLMLKIFLTKRQNWATFRRAAPLIIKGTGTLLIPPSCPFKYWFIPLFFLTFLHSKLSDSNLHFCPLKSFDHIYIYLCFKVIQASTFKVQREEYFYQKYYNLVSSCYLSCLFTFSCISFILW